MRRGRSTSAPTLAHDSWSGMRQIVPNPTDPAIRDAQNTERSLRLLAAQRRLYSDAKSIHNVRIGLILAGSALSIGAGFIWPAARVSIGLLTAFALILLSVVGGGREGRRVREA